MVKITIYMLTDPRDGEPRYVGKTNQKLKSRLSAHCNEPPSNCHRSNWIQQLKRLGLKPGIEAIEELLGDWPWQESERFWIQRLKAAGFRLTNNTSGGDGVRDLPKETRERMRKTWLGRKHKPSTIEKLKACRANFKHRPETKVKIGLAHKGRKITWTDKIAESNRSLSKEQAEEIRKRLMAGELNKSLALEYGVHRTTLSKIKTGTYFDKYRKKS